MTYTILKLAATAGATLLIGLTPAIGAGAAESPPIDVGNRTYFADGTVEVEVPDGTFSLSECGSGQFCVWSQANYSGSFRYKTGTGAKALGGTVGSFWNNRSSAARLYSNTGNSSTCYASGAKKSSVSSGYSSASEVHLLSGSC